MVFVVNTELNMGVGKIAAQVGHAAVLVSIRFCHRSHKSTTTCLHSGMILGKYCREKYLM